MSYNYSVHGDNDVVEYIAEDNNSNDYSINGDDDVVEYIVKDNESNNDAKITASHTGNCLLDFPSLVHAMKATSCCKHCVKDDWDYFLLFCEEKSKLVDREATKRRNSKLKLKYIQKHHNIISWHKEWVEIKNTNESHGVLTMEETTFGLATNVTIKCNICKAMESNRTTLWCDFLPGSSYPESRSEKKGRKLRVDLQQQSNVVIINS